MNRPKQSGPQSLFWPYAGELSTAWRRRSCGGPRPAPAPAHNPGGGLRWAGAAIWFLLLGQSSGGGGGVRSVGVGISLCGASSRAREEEAAPDT